MRVAPHVLISAVVDDFVACKLRADNSVLSGVIRHKEGFAAHLGNEDGAQRLGADLGDVEGADLASSLNQRKGNLLTRSANVATLAFADVLVFFSLPPT